TGADNIFFESPDKIIARHKESSRNYFILKDKKFAYALPSFIQVNEEQNENIINIITGYIKNIGINFKNVLDLYCGYGNITLFLAAYAKTVTGIEANSFSIKLGEKNLKLNNIKNINFIMSDVVTFIEKADKKMARYDLIVLDPPKAGIKGLVPKIAKLNPAFVIYVSCDTVTLLRDLKAFVKMGYTLEQINLIDMFPRTYHMEHIAFLSK
ncbi:MAG TPA: class I SAM-dependent RNA methyltransferase, partial [bacterium]|nr:class I SAM-dependent RNA methyltransferase [bacterium]